MTDTDRTDRDAHEHTWYDISVRDSDYDEEVCVTLDAEGCGHHRRRRRVAGIRLGPSPQPWEEFVVVPLSSAEILMVNEARQELAKAKTPTRRR
jgi:hypothetical protein